MLNKKVAEFVSTSKAKPKNGLFIAGKIAAIRGTQVSVIYGIESYFVPEGEGLKIERSRRDMYAKIGNATILDKA